MTFGIIYHENTCLQLIYIFACNLGLLTSHSSRGDKFEIAYGRQYECGVLCCVSRYSERGTSAHILRYAYSIPDISPGGTAHRSRNSHVCARREGV
jgi:hypothetical protein